MQCRICKKRLSEYHNACPVCGEPMPNKESDIAWVEILLVVALLSMLVYWVNYFL